MNKDIVSIGVWDQDLDLFENQYAVPAGISYNSYLIIDDKIALIDTTDRRCADEWKQNLANALPEGRKPDYLIVEHLEPDHSALIEWVMATYPDCRMVCTAVAQKMLGQIAECEAFADRIMAVKDGDRLSLGRHELRFITAPMVHWPEVMMVYDELSRTLFSADGFGRFGNPDAGEDWEEEARRYYFNIVGKYGNQVQAVLKKLAGTPIDAIAPLHGPVLEGDVARYVKLYDIWSRYEPEHDGGVLVAYGSIHGMTAQAAEVMKAILLENGATEVIVRDMSRSDMSQAVADAFKMGRMVLMCPTYDADIFPPMYDFIHHLALKGYSTRRVAIVENGLWAPVAGKKMLAMLQEMKDITIVEPIVTLRGRLTSINEAQLKDMARKMMTPINLVELD